MILTETDSGAKIRDIHQMYNKLGHASDVGAIGEYIGNYCELINPFEEQEETDKFVRVYFEIRDENRNLSKAAAYVNKNYDICITAKKYEEEFLKVIG